jgi:large subunit ribosomal protein L3
MARRHKPRRGSLAYWPRRRAASPVARIRRWPRGPPKPHLEGFAGYKVGMTHAFIVDFRKRSTTAGQEVAVPVTVLETPPLRVAAVRLYASSNGARSVSGELWASELLPQLGRRIPLPKTPPGTAEREAFQRAPGEEVTVLVQTQPHLVSGVPSKTPDLFEVRVSGEDFAERRDWALALLGKEVHFEDFAREGEMVDVVAVTKGKGFQGHIRRFHVKLQPRKNSKHRRMIGTLGPHNPSYVTFRIPQAGQMGYHRRTEFNKRLLKVVRDPKTDPIQVAGGFLHYGEVRNGYALLHGSIPGPTKRLVRLRLPMRFRGGPQEKVEFRYRSVHSKQGV